jgi:hypothetical protein
VRHILDVLNPFSIENGGPLKIQQVGIFGAVHAAMFTAATLS